MNLTQKEEKVVKQMVAKFEKISRRWKWQYWLSIGITTVFLFGGIFAGRTWQRFINDLLSKPQLTAESFDAENVKGYIAFWKGVEISK